MSVIRAVPFGTVIHRKKKKNACLLDTYEKLRLCKYEFVNRYNYYDLHGFLPVDLLIVHTPLKILLWGLGLRGSSFRSFSCDNRLILLLVLLPAYSV